MASPMSNEHAMDYNNELRPALKARTVLGDAMIWAISSPCGDVVNYDVRGLSDEGVRLDPLLSRGAKAVGRGVVGFADGVVNAALGGEEDDAKPWKSPPDFVVFSKSPECLAIRYLDYLDDIKSGTWALTAWGLVQVGFRVLPAEPKPQAPEKPVEPESDEPKSFLGKAIKFGKAVKEIVSLEPEPLPEFREPDPEPMVPVGVVKEISAAHIAGFEAASRRWKANWKSCFRVKFVDGSGWDMFMK